MKKRIGTNEMDGAKRASRMLFVICFLFLILIIGGASIIAFYSDGFSKKNNSNKTNVIYNENNKTNESNKKEDIIFSKKVDVRDSNVVDLFNIVKITANTCDGYNIQKSVYVDDMSDKCKMSLARNIYSKKSKVNGNMTYVLESDVRDAYNKLFGYGTYNVRNTVPYYNVNLAYSTPNKYYFTENVVKEEIGTLISYEKIIDAYRENDTLYIKSIALYYEEVNKVFCGDARCEDVVESVRNEPSYPDYYDLYVDSRGDKLSKFVYMFKLNDSGFYNYVGYEKIEETE